MRLQVLERRLYSFIEEAQRFIALVTEQPTDRASRVIVVDLKKFALLGRACADRAHTALRGKHAFVLVQLDPVFSA